VALPRGLHSGTCVMPYCAVPSRAVPCLMCQAGPGRAEPFRAGHIVSGRAVPSRAVPRMLCHAGPGRAEPCRAVHAVSYRAPDVVTGVAS
jgi:hypothetical protein